MRGNGWVEGWQLSGVGTFQSGRPFSITDEDFSGFLFASQNPRPNLAPGADARRPDDERIGRVAGRCVSQPRRVRELGRAVRHPRAQLRQGPGQRRLDISLSKMTRRSTARRSSSGSRSTTSPTRRPSGIP